jgi:hypothetical protein
MPMLSTRQPRPAAPTMRTDDLLAFIVERNNVYRRKNRGEPKPWTTWPILREWRFTNIYRELDTVTQWIAEHWREPRRADPDLWFALTVARFVNWPDTLAELGYPVPWRPERFIKVLESRQQRGEKVYSAAYTIHTDPYFDGSKADYLAGKVLDPLWRERKDLRHVVHGMLKQVHEALTDCEGIGSFMAGQIIADLKYVPPLRSATDWWTWACPGPGSERGLNRVLGRRVEASWTDWEWRQRLRELHQEMRPLVKAARLPALHAQDLQSCLCEWDKFERVRLGQGNPRAKYAGV